MSLSTAQKGLKFIAIIQFILAILIVVIAVVALNKPEATQLIEEALAGTNVSATVGKLVIGGIIVLTALLSLCLGKLCLDASKDSNKVTPILVLSALRVASMFSQVMKSGLPNMLKTTGWGTVVLDVLTLIFALFVMMNRDQRG